MKGKVWKGREGKERERKGGEGKGKGREGMWWVVFRFVIKIVTMCLS